MRRRRGRFESLGPTLDRVLGDLGETSAARAVRIAERWSEALGPEIARHCQPTALQGETLLAEVDSSVWCQQLTLKTPEILARLRETLGDDAPAALRLRLR